MHEDARALSFALFSAGSSNPARIVMIAILLHSKSGFFMANYGNGVILILNMLPIDTMNENVDTW